MLALLPTSRVPILSSRNIWSDYEPIILTPEQAFRLVETFPILERTLTLLAAATGLRIREYLALQWQELDFVHQQIQVRRTLLGGQIGKPKTQASSKPVVMGSIMAQDYLRTAAVKLGILAEQERRRFGFHNLRHSLASYLVTQTKTDIKTVQSLLRHADVGTTLDLYTHAINQDKLVAQDQVMEAMMKPGLVN